MTDSGFTVDVDQNQYLPEGGRDVSAIVTVASGSGVAALPPGGQRGDAADSATTSFFIVTGTSAALDGVYTAFGRVVDGLRALAR